MSRKLWFLTLGIAAVVLCSAAGAVEVKLTVEDPAKVARKGEAVTTGVPFAKGVLKDVSKLSVSAGGKKVPAQLRATMVLP